MTTMTIPHDAHADWEDVVVGDNQLSVQAAVAICNDCDLHKVFLVREYRNSLWAWNEAARARDIHIDTHLKEIE